MKKRIFRPALAATLAAVLLIQVTPVHTQTAASVPLHDTPVYAQTADSFTPHLVTTATEKDLAKAAVTQITFNDKIFIRADIPADGCLFMELHVSSPDFIYLEFYSDPDSLPDTSVTCRCTSGQGNRGTVSQYLKKGTYYIGIRGDLTISNTLEIKSLLYRQRDMALKNGDSVAAYCDGAHGSYYSYQATANGYITLTETTLRGADIPPAIVLCDKNGGALTERVVGYESQTKVVYAVKKNTTYKIWLSASDNTMQHFYKLKLKFTKYPEKSGAKKSKARQIALSEKVRGTVFAEEKADKADWYKFTNNKRRKVSMEYTGSITSGSIKFDIYDAGGCSLGTYEVVTGLNETKTYTITDSGNGLLSGGTYYIRVNKSRQTATGIYSFTLHEGV